jgi:hypothetical protein
MRLVFGVLGLVLVLAIVGSLAKRQLQSLQAAPRPASGASQALVGTPVQPLQQRVTDDVNRLMQQAPARLQGAEQ